MRRRHWSFRLIQRYTLLQIPGVLLVALLLTVLQRWFNWPIWIIGVGLAAWIIKDALLFPLTWRAYDWEQASGTIHSLVGQQGITSEPLAPTGYVLILGERWRAEPKNGAPIEAGTAVWVREVQGLTLIVARDGEERSVRSEE